VLQRACDSSAQTERWRGELAAQERLQQTRMNVSVMDDDQMRMVVVVMKACVRWANDARLELVCSLLGQLLLKVERHDSRATCCTPDSTSTQTHTPNESALTLNFNLSLIRDCTKLQQNTTMRGCCTTACIASHSTLRQHASMHALKLIILCIHVRQYQGNALQNTATTTTSYDSMLSHHEQARFHTWQRRWSQHL